MFRDNRAAWPYLFDDHLASFHGPLRPACIYRQTRCGIPNRDLERVGRRSATHRGIFCDQHEAVIAGLIDPSIAAQLGGRAAYHQRKKGCTAKLETAGIE